MSTLWKDLITIPESVDKGDFVLALSEGVRSPESTLKHYVVTPNLVDAFDEALKLIDHATNSNKSRGAYLHGSFGSGKSHFMAVLHLLLSGNEEARSIPELADVAIRYQHLVGKNYLLVPYHMVGATSIEAGVFGGYMRHIQKLHPDAPLPGLFASEEVFANATSLRNSMGDAAFFAALNATGGDGSGGDGWGDFAAGWDAERFEAALAASPADKKGRTLRAELVGDLVQTLLPAMKGIARGVAHGEAAWIGFDAGLEVVSQHAKSLGYDGIVLFLDELILWLASRAADMQFLNAEAPKMAKLVEAENSDRPIPLISFIARQRDLRDFLGDGSLGSEYATLNQSLDLWSGRFGVITLEDRNLPAIVSKRILAPVSPDARNQIDAAFEKLSKKLRGGVRDTLLADDYDLQMFRQVYPFSPALVKALVALSAALQRERTALRLLSLLLAEHRDDLELGHAIPVGDLWDVVARGEEPFSDALKSQFRAARRLYEERLRPAICEARGTTPDEVDAWRRKSADVGDANRKKANLVRNDERIAKTLLIAALVPGVDVLQNLTVSRLAALNHGAVKSPIAGTEARQVANLVKGWATTVTELTISEDNDPLVQLKLSSVDLNAVIDFSAAADNPGNRRRLIKEMLFESMGVRDTSELFQSFAMEWRGAKRDVRVRYDNVRNVENGVLEGEGERWTIVIDYPFDEGNCGPLEDKLRVDEFLSIDAVRASGGARTLCWMPDFLSSSGTDLVGRLVKVQQTLKRFDDASRHLPPADRDLVRTQLETHQTMLEQQLRATLLRAYHLSSERRDEIDENLAAPKPLMSLLFDYAPQVPSATTFGDGMRELVRGALAHQFAAAPAIPDSPTGRADLQRVCDELVRAFESEDKSYEVVERKVRAPLRELVEPLGLGKMGDTRFSPGEERIEAITRAVSGHEGPLRVSDLRRVLDPDDARTGLPSDLSDLLIIVWAAQTNRSFRRGGLPEDVSIRNLHDDAEVVREALPSQASWDALEGIAVQLFGLSRPKQLNARRVNKFARDIRAKLDDAATEVVQLPEALTAVAERIGLTSEQLASGARYRTAVSAAQLVSTAPAEPTALLEHIAGFRYQTSVATVGKALLVAKGTLATLNSSGWQGLETLAKGIEGVDTSMLDTAREWFRFDEHVRAYSVLANARAEALELLADLVVPPPQPPPPPPPPVGLQVIPVVTSDDLSAALEQARTALSEGAKVEIRITPKGNA